MKTIILHKKYMFYKKSVTRGCIKLKYQKHYELISMSTHITRDYETFHIFFKCVKEALSRFS